MQIKNLHISTLLWGLMVLATGLPVAASADSGFYIGGSAGGANIEADLGGISIPGLPNSIDEDDTAIKLFGGYKLDLPLVDIGVELGYVNFGEPDVDIAGDLLLVDTTGINLWGVASFNLGLFDVFGKLGYLAWDVDAEFLGSSGKEDGSDLGYGVGAAANIGPLELRGELEVYDLDGTDLSMLSLGLVYYFD